MAQSGGIYADKVRKPDYSYRSTENKWYWKNRPPFAGYWQQDVDCKLSASIDEQTDIITGNETLTYYNNSPDTLYFVYFHLYEEAFQPGSYMDELTRANKVKTTFGKYEAQGLGTQIPEITLIKRN